MGQQMPQLKTSMKTRIGVIATFLMFIACPFALAQRGGVDLAVAEIGRPRYNPPKIDPRRALLMQTTDIQREAFAYCMTATESARKTGRLMGDNSYWYGTHGPYDFSAIYRNKDQLQSAVTAMARAHRQFLMTLSSHQDTALRASLGKLEQLQVVLNLQMSRLEEELTVARPDSHRTSVDVYDLGATVDQWRYEHKKIAKKMGIEKPKAGMGD